MSKDKIIIETREVKALGCGHAIRSFFRGLIGFVLAIGLLLLVLISALVG